MKWDTCKSTFINISHNWGAVSVIIACVIISEPLKKTNYTISITCCIFTNSNTTNSDFRIYFQITNI